MKLLDLFCGAGGASQGYINAGFETVGVDIAKQRHYRGKFIKADALEYLASIIASGEIFQYDLIHASPPCQKFSQTKSIHKNDHPDLVGPVRELLKQTDRNYVIENVVGAPLIDPILLCGTMFNLMVYRHRLFECSFPITQPPHPEHAVKVNNMGRKPEMGEYMTVVGHFTDVKYARVAMGISWMSRNELAQAIPPAYTKYIGEQYLMQPYRNTLGKQW